MLHVNTIGTKERGRAGQLRPVGGASRESQEVAAPTSAAEATFSLLKVERILLPCDFSAASVRLLQWLTRSADDTEAKLSVLHVVHPWLPPIGLGAPYYFDANMERIKAARAHLRRLVRKTSRRLAAYSVHVVIGRPSDEIVRFARSTRANLVVMASHGEHGLKGLLASGTTERVARRAPCPVLVLPEAMLAGRGKPDSGAWLTNCNTDAIPWNAPCPVFSLRAGPLTAGQ